MAAGQLRRESRAHPTFRTPARVRRLARDPYVLLTAAEAVPAVIVAAFGTIQPVLEVVAASVLFIALQAILSLLPASNRDRRAQVAWSVGRLLIALAYASVVTQLTGTGAFRPLAALYVPVVAMAAALGTPQAVILGAASVLLYLTPELLAPGDSSYFALRGVALAGVAVILAVGTRRTVSTLERAVLAMRAAVAEHRRRSRQIAGIEEVGRTLASAGPRPELLERVMDVLAERFGYDHISLYLVDEAIPDLVHLGAQRGYADPIRTFQADAGGVIGRVIRGHELIFLADVAQAPEYRSADAAVRSEICAPLLAQGELLGVLNIEATSSDALDETDVRLVRAVADRVAAALALGRERQALEARAAIFKRLTELGTIINATLEPDALYGSLVRSVSHVVDADTVALTVLDRTSGRYFVRGVHGGVPEFLGAEVRPGEGMAGRAIRDRALALVHDYRRDAFPASVQASGPEGYATAAGLPLVREGTAVGALTILRADERPFTPLEREAMEQLASQAALAISNVFLHADVAELAVRDALTGLYNRRHLDAVFEQLLVTRSRTPLAERPEIAVILFDLDHFGKLNQDRGHQAGDMVLREFGGLLRERFRAADLVARYGGEEFLVVMVGASRDDAVAAAEQVRLALARRSLVGPDGEALAATVSAGCAGLDENEPTREALLRGADVALYMAKRAGRNQVVAA
ncbi:MAG: diguanylate cyclase [Candidatus Limnocylindrales bacterium]